MLGAHLSKSTAIDDLEVIGGEICQIFISNPRSYYPPTKGDLVNFKPYAKNLVVHLPYLVNPASEGDEVRANSMKLLLNTSKGMGADYLGLVVHAGQGGKKASVEEAIERWLKLFKGEGFETRLLIENTAGGNAAPGRSLEDLVTLVKGLREMDLNVGVCYDTCHAWAAGVGELTKGFIFLEEELGKVDLIHFNDSRDELGSARDRHALLQKGLIPWKELVELYRYAAKKDVNMILETPGDTTLWKEEILLLKSL